MSVRIRTSLGDRRVWWLLTIAALQACLLISPWPGFTVYAQETTFAQELQRKLDLYYAAANPLVIDMQFNQPAYVPGDTAWFSLWLTTEREGLPVAGRQVVNVNLATRDGEVILRHRVLVNNGLAHAQVFVPATLSPGVYTVVSWTEWMENDDPSMYSYQNFVVCGDRRYAYAPMPLRAYPEGGALVQGVSNRLAITGRPGTTVSLNAGKQVAGRVTLDNSGYGTLSFTPVTSGQYSISDAQTTTNLPTSADGVALALDLYDSASTLTINLQSSQRREGCQLTLVSRGRVVYAAMVSLGEDGTSIAIPRRSLPEGLLLATVFDRKGRALAERILMAHSPDPPAKVMTDRPNARPRERVSVSVDAAGLAATPLTVTIYAEDLFPNFISSGKQLAPSARLPFGALDFQTDGSWNVQQWNAFLTTQPWMRFKWPAIWTGAPTRTHSLNKFLKFTGRVLLPEKQASFDSVRVTFFLRGEARIYEAYTRPTGEFDLELFFDFDNTEDVIYTVDRKGQIIPDASIELQKENDPQFVLRPLQPTSGTEPYVPFTSFSRSVRDAYQQYGFVDDAGLESDPNAHIEDELFEADVVVKLDEFILFPSMEETLREIVPKLQHRWRGNHHSVRVALSDPDILAAAEPVYFIDGVLSDDTDYFMSLRPADVATIKIVSSQRKLQAIGILGRNGVVFVSTKLHDNHLKVPRSRKMFQAVGFTRPVAVNRTISSATRTPMIRASVFFESSLKIDGAGKGSFDFVVPDNIGRFRIEVTGLSRSGTLSQGITQVYVSPPAATH